MAFVLLCIFNACMSLGHFPTQWKNARVICIPKPGKAPNRVENHRPISLLNTLGKLFEKLIIHHLRRVTEELDILPDHQFGFRSEHSTTHQVARLLNFIVEGYNTNRHTAGAFFDISKAFDKVWHEGLLWKLHCFGYPKWCLKIIASWLREREFYVAWSTASSAQRRIRAGVPQGSVLSPLLFNIYTADFPSNFGPNVTAALYADDAALLARSSKQFKAVEYLQRATDDLVEWYECWRLAVNSSKTQAIVFSRALKEPGELLVGVTEVPWKDTVDYLGVCLDRRLSMKPHSRRKAAVMLARRRQLSSMLGNVSLPTHRRLLLHKMILRPIIDYASPAWSGLATKGALHSLQVADRKCLRSALRLGWTTTNDALHIIAKTPPLEEVFRARAQDFYSRLQHSSHGEIRHIAAFHVMPWDKYRRPRASTGQEEDLPPAQERR